MEMYRRSQFFISPPAILKVVIATVLMAAMILFLLDDKCPSSVSFVTVFVLPCVVCAVATLVSYITAILVLLGRRNPLTTPTWVKGDVWLSVSALVVMLVGSIFTVTNSNTRCPNNSLTVGAIALGFISVILFAISGAVTYLIFVRHQQEVKEAQRAQLSARRFTHSELA